MSEPAPELPADTLVSAMDNARRGVVTHITIQGERVAAIVPEALLEVFNRLLALLTSEYSPGLAATLPAVFPWAHSLPPHELKAFARELREAFGTESAEMVDQVITGWRATADIYADPALIQALRAPVADSGPVPEPFHG
ncbi:MAG TPA: hypothetical protein VIX86_21830 [Streptosporangiaceae bacterium]